ncbi:MAG: rhodanese-like domain-containing protein [Pricia sp.]
MKYIGLSVVWLFCCLGHAQSTELAITEFSQKDENTGTLIDVRTPTEYEAGFLENALNIDWFESGFVEKVEALDISKDEPIYLYCKKGGRSTKAAQVLDSLGYQKVVNLIGGYDAYLSKKE